MEGVTIATILTSVGDFFTAAVGWMGDVIDVIVSNPILLIMVVCVPLAGYAVGLLRRLLSL